MKKSVLLISCSLVLSCLVSCGQKHYVVFYNYDGSVLYKVAYKKGMDLVYGGEEPTKPSDEVYDYTFTGWNHSLYDVDSSQNYYAQYDKELREFEVTFRNYDNSLLAKANVKYGESAVQYAPTGLTRSDDLNTTPRLRYTFNGWDGGDLTYVTSNMICTAHYDETILYKVVFIDNDGSILHSEYVEEGKDATFTFSNYKEADSTHFYVFDSWSNSPTKVNGDLEIHAQYKIYNAYTVTFLDYDGKVLYQTKIPEGYTAEFKGATPHRDKYEAGNYTYTYTFTGWDKNLTNVRSSFETRPVFEEESTYYNATYQAALSSFRGFCTKLDSDDVYKGVVHSGLNGTMYEQIFACYDPSREVCYIYFYMSAQTGQASSTMIEIYLPKVDPGKYNVYYAYRFGSNSSTNLSFSGSTSFSSSFSSGSSISFSSYHNYGSTSLQTNEETCALMINKALNKCSSKSFFKSQALGFNNY